MRSQLPSSDSNSFIYFVEFDLDPGIIRSGCLIILILFV